MGTKWEQSENKNPKVDGNKVGTRTQKVGQEWEQSGNKVGTRTAKWGKNGNKVGTKLDKNGNKVGTKWEQEPQSGTGMGTQ